MIKPEKKFTVGPCESINDVLVFDDKRVELGLGRNILGQVNRWVENICRKTGQKENKRSNKHPDHPWGVPIQPHMLALEPRIMFDGAGMDTFLDTTQDADSGDQPLPWEQTKDEGPNETEKLLASLEKCPQGQSATQAERELLQAFEIAGENLDRHEGNNIFPNRADNLFPLWSEVKSPEVQQQLLWGIVEGDNREASPEKEKGGEIVFIDSRVEDKNILINGIDPYREVVILDADRDGVKQIAEVLDGRQDLDAIHIVSHGNEAQVELGNTTLSEGSIPAYLGELNNWGEALGEDGDILFYGCNVGERTDGDRFVSRMADLTGADVAASDDITGSAERAGDWDLEATKGPIEAAVVFNAATQKNYSGIFGTVANTNDSGVGSFRQAVLDAAAGETIDFAPGLSGSTITLTAEVALNVNNIIIDGDVDGDDKADIIVSGGGTTRVFNVTADATIRSLTIADGSKVGSSGAGIYLAGADLTVEDTRITNNTATWGGGFYNNGTSSLTLERVLVDNNHAVSMGGGGYNSGPLTILNSTFSANTSEGWSGGLHNSAASTIDNSTFVYNITDSDASGNGGGGGIRMSAGGATLSNTIFYGNEDGFGVDSDIANTVTSGGYNLFGTTAGGSVAGGGGTDIIGSDPLFAALADNGGTTLTHA